MHLCEPISTFPHSHHYLGLLWRLLLLLAFLLAVPFLAGCRHRDLAPAPSPPQFVLSSPPLSDGLVPRQFTCDGEDQSPPLTWSAAPPGTKSLALTVIDLDAPEGTFIHWFLYDLPPTVTSLSAGVQKQAELADGSRQASNDFDRVGYGGPCPPPGKPHRYLFNVFAFNEKFDLPAGASRSQIETAMKGHLLGGGQFLARYGR